MGYSCGAEKAVIAALTASDYGIHVKKDVFMEPVALTDRGMPKLLKDFRSAEPELARYQAASQVLFSKQSESSTYLKEKVEFIKYVAGLLRVSNLAIEHFMAHKEFGYGLHTAMSRQPEMAAQVVRGTNSELSLEAAFNSVMDPLEQRFYPRLGRMIMNGMHHAGGDDIDLHTAMVLQGLILSGC